MKHCIGHYKTAKRLNNLLILTFQLNLILQHSTDICCVIFVTCTFLDSCLYEYQIHPLFQIDLVLTCQEPLESQPIKKLFDICIFTIGMQFRSLKCCIQMHQKPFYRNGVREEKMNGNWLVLQKIKIKQSDRARRRIAKQYAHWRISDDYSTLGVNIWNKFNPV